MHNPVWIMFRFGGIPCAYHVSPLGSAGRGKQSHAYIHSVQQDHHVFINLETGKVYDENNCPSHIHAQIYLFPPLFCH
jgi:hypothetical protein